MKRLFLKSLHYIFVRLLGIVQPISIGVRVMLIRDEQVLLVKHSYQDAWYFPGGGVKRGESLAEAARREAMEEVGATLGDLELFGVYKNSLPMRTDHIAVFLCRDFTFSRTNDWEIEKLELFPFNDLPESTSPGIRHRLDDYIAGREPKDGFGLW